MDYKEFNYIFPPRPKNAIPSEEIDFYNTPMFFAQPKLNGSNTVIFMNEKETYVMNRRGERQTRFNVPMKQIRALYKGSGWMVLNGENMNKAKNDSKGENFNNNLVLFDILVFDGDYLVGRSYQERIALLDNLYGEANSEEEFLYSISDNVYRVKSYDSDFDELYGSLVKIDMYEGLVIKRKRSKLEIGTTESNNTKSQIKCRKPTRNYSF